MQRMHNLHFSLNPSSNVKKRDPSSQTITLNGSCRGLFQVIWDGCERLLWNLAINGSQQAQETD